MATDFKKVQPGDPAWLVDAFKLDGMRETVGTKNNPGVLQLFADAGFAGVKSDATAWCAAFVGAMLRRAGYKASGSLAARSYEGYGEEAIAPNRGDIAVFKRGNSSWQGHVSFFLKIEGDYVWVFGGNQSDAVNASRYKRGSLLSIRRPVAVDRLAAAPMAAMPANTAQRPAGARSEASASVVLAVQRALIEKGYNEAGTPDGLFGTKTRGAILAFEADQGLALSGKPSADVLASILGSEPRPVSAARAGGKPADKTVINAANATTGVAGTGIVAGGLALAEPVVKAVEGSSGIATRIQAAVAPFTDLLVTFWPVLAVLGCAIVIWFALNAKKTVVEDFRSGKLTR
ncbi:MAG: TIGR02594 family protein [Hyphomicrobium sp.]|jgi:uncharacterized protein (TIGR02594 family)